VETAAASLPTTEAAVRTPGRRVHFVDLLRLLASVMMVHGHTMDSLMAEELRQGLVFQRWTWMRGLVSVTFLVAAGLAFHLSTLARFERHRADRSKVLGRFRRVGWLLLLGYGLHFPWAAIVGVDATASLHEFAMVDVLQCIAITLLVLQTMTVLATSPRQVVVASAVLAAVCFGLAPLTERLDPDGPLRPLVNYLTHSGGSLFPLLPWAGHMFAGVVLADWVLPQGARTVHDPTPRLLLAALLVVGAALGLELGGLDHLAEGLSHNAEPSFNLLKLGLVIAVGTVLAAAGRAFLGDTRLPRWLETLAGESLALYVFHLQILFAAGIGLVALYGRSLSLPVALAVAVAMIPISGAWGLWFHRHKRWRRARFGW
jgi:uncharacterized membrane protein